MAMRFYFTSTVREFPNIVVAWNDLGDVYKALKRKEDAIICYKQALKIKARKSTGKKIN
jgi:tetratricopeptide (TPR) repeat protein